MKKTLLTLLVFLFSALLAVSAPVDEQSARKLASDFLRSKMPSTRSASSDLKRAITGVVDGDDAGVYVFNAADAFVIVSGDDNTMPVLGYSSTGKYDADKAPASLKNLLLYYQQEVARFQVVTRGETVDIHEKVEPLIKTKWGQSAPYNLMCPVDTDNKQSVTGCVATATAQIMYYYRYPSTYSWDDMKLTYGGDETGAAADAVAKLMADIGTAVFMNYSSNVSGASDDAACEALRYDFGYSETTEYVSRCCYTAKQWDELIYHELQSKRPVLLGAQAVSPADGMTGHEFVVDGYDDKGFYHINWGWDGISNGYFALSVLNPYSQSTGGNAGSSGFNIEMSAIIGIEPATTPMVKTARLMQYNTYVVNLKDVYTRKSTSDNFPTFRMSADVYNVTLPETDRSYAISFDLYQNGKFVKALDTEDRLAIKYDYGYTVFSDIAIGKDLADGVYQIRLRSKELDNGDVDWSYCLGGYGAWLEVEIKGLNMTVKPLLYQASDAYSLIVNSVALGDTRQQGKRMRIQIDLTNTSKVSNAPIYLWGTTGDPNEDSKLITGVGSNLNSGETGLVELLYTPQRSGNFTFYLSSNYETLIDTLYTFTADVSEMSMADVVMNYTFTADGAEQVAGGWNSVSGNTLKGELKITNHGSETYEDALFIVLWKSDGSTAIGNYTSVDKVSDYVVIPLGESLVVPFEFSNLLAGSYYALSVSAIEKGNNIMVGDLILQNVFYINGDTGIRQLQLDEPEAEVYDLRGVRIGKVASLNSLPKGIYIINKKKIINK